MNEIMTQSHDFSGVRFVLHALGCRTNQYEIQAIRRQLEAIGCVPVYGQEQADLCIINTCAVTCQAESSSMRKIQSLVNTYPKARIVVTGCYAVHAYDRLRQIEGIDDVIIDKEQLVATLFPTCQPVSFAVDQFYGHTRAFIKIQDGCNHFCSYCIIPFLRGRSRSRSVDDVEAEVRRLVENGYKEIVLTGVDLGDFCSGKDRLAQLIVRLDAISGLQRLRLSSINPHQIDEELATVLRSSDRVCPSLHLVLQSGSNHVLQRMNRPYTKEMFLETASLFPNFVLTTDCIVGFPGEREEDFLETVAVVEQVGFLKVHVFPYSLRPNTRAARYADAIDLPVIHNRVRRLLDRARAVSARVRSQYVGKDLEVLVESGTIGSSWYKAHSRHGIPVLVPVADVRPNQILTVHIAEDGDEALVSHVQKLRDNL